MLLLLAPRTSADGYLSPSWVQTFGGGGADQGWGIEVGPAGEAYLVGFVQGQGNDVFVVRIEPSGTVAWESPIGRPLSQKGFEVVHADGFLYVGGVTQSDARIESQDMYVLKLWPSNGTLIWETSWNGPADLYDEADGIVVEDGFVFASGWADVRLDYTAGQVALVKFAEADGTPVQNATWGGTGRDGADGSMASDGTNLYISGITGGVNFFTGGDVLVAAFNKTTLAEVWNASWGGPAYDDGLGLTIHGGNLYVTGLTLSFGADGILLLKYDLAGTQIWNTTWGGSGSESARSVEVAENGSAVFVAGQTTTYGNGSTDVVLLEFTPDGGFVSYRTWGGVGGDVSQGIAVRGEAIFIAGNEGVQGFNTDAVAMRVGPGSILPGPDGDRPPGNPVVVVVAIAIVVAVVLILVVALAATRRRRP
jgi:hypothetical protein